MRSVSKSDKIVIKNLKIPQIDLKNKNLQVNKSDHNIYFDNNPDLNSFDFHSDSTRILVLEKNTDNALAQKAKSSMNTKNMLNENKIHKENTKENHRTNYIKELLKKEISYGNCLPYFFVNGVPLVLIGPQSNIVFKKKFFFKFLIL